MWSSQASCFSSLIAYVAPREIAGLINYVSLIIAAILLQDAAAVAYSGKQQDLFMLCSAGHLWQAHDLCQVRMYNQKIIIELALKQCPVCASFLNGNNVYSTPFCFYFKTSTLLWAFPNIYNQQKNRHSNPKMCRWCNYKENQLSLHLSNPPMVVMNTANHRCCSWANIPQLSFF